jgi:hypothetical protein
MMKLALFGLAASLIDAAPLEASSPQIERNVIPGIKIVPSYYWSRIVKDGKPQSAFSNPASYSPPKSTLPEIQVEKSVVFPGTIRKKIRYGPYRLPKISEDNWQKQNSSLGGMADEYHYNITKPCVDCYVASISADIEYFDGAKVPSSKAWLHHSALISQGEKVVDPVCGETDTETLFSSGNERATTRYFADGSPIKAGFRIRPEDTITSVGLYKSEVDEDQDIWLSLSWEYFDTATNPGFRDSHVIWMSTLQGLGCKSDKSYTRNAQGIPLNPFGETNLTAAGVPKKQTFAEHSLPWTSPVNGIIMGMGGHLHDGGTSLEFFGNDKRLCEIKASYASGPAAEGAMGSNHAGGEHVR